MTKNKKTPNAEPKLSLAQSYVGLVCRNLETSTVAQSHQAPWRTTRTQKDERTRFLRETLVRSSHIPNRFPDITATMPERNEPSALALTENHTVATSVCTNFYTGTGRTYTQDR